MLNRKSCICHLLISQVTLYVSEDIKKLPPSTLVSRSVCSSVVSFTVINTGYDCLEIDKQSKFIH